MKEIAMRQAFGEGLIELAEKDDKVVVLDADVSSSTQTVHFGKKYPERFFNVGVAEANMVDVAAGLATTGLKPVVSAFAIFLTLKATDQIRNVICYNNLPVVLVGGYAGLSDSFDGASHQSITDLAIMRAFPNMTVVVPADANDLKNALFQALEMNSPVYIRGSRNPSPVFSTSLYEKFKIGEIRKLNDGSDITVVVNGIPTYMAIEAVKHVERSGIKADLLELSTLKSFNSSLLVESAKKTGCVLTIEEHNVIGGLYGTVSEVLSEKYPVKISSMGIQDTFTETGPYPELLEKYGLSTHLIEEQIVNILS